jgi:metal-responsive CopG/Arc/MetJ family transcriptional regulator
MQQSSPQRMATRQPTRPRRTITVTVDLPPELVQTIDAIADRDLSTRSATCRRLLAQAVRQLSDEG